MCFSGKGMDGDAARSDFLTLRIVLPPVLPSCTKLGRCPTIIDSLSSEVVPTRTVSNWSRCMASVKLSFKWSWINIYQAKFQPINHVTERARLKPVAASAVRWLCKPWISKWWITHIWLTNWRQLPLNPSSSAQSRPSTCASISARQSPWTNCWKSGEDLAAHHQRTST